MTKHFVRIVFIVSVLVLCFSIELLWQHERRESMTRSQPGHERIVVIGGSIAYGLSAHVQKYLRELDRGANVDVIDMTDPKLTIDDAIAKVEQALEIHRPKAILMMIGMHEFSFEPEWTRNARKFLASGNDAAFTKMVVERVDEGNLRAPLMFFFLNRKAIQECSCRSLLSDRLESRFDDLVTRAPRNAGTDLILFQLVRLLSAVRMNSADVTELGDISIRWKALQFILPRMEKWARETESMDYATFVKSGPDTERITRGWFWYSWRRAELDEKVHPLSFFAERPKNLGLIVPLPEGAARGADLIRLFPDTRQRKVVEAMLSSPQFEPMPLHSGEARTKHALAEFDLSQLKSFAASASRDTRFFLLHYPGVRLPIVDDLAHRLQFPTLASETRLTRIIGTPSEAVYFEDRVGRSGHLTQAGFEIYSRVVATELTEVFR